VTRRIRVGVLMGGASSERSISLASGGMIAEHLPRERYEAVMLDTLALMAWNANVSPELRERARALLEGRSLPEADVPDDLRADVERAARASTPATRALDVSGSQRPPDVCFIALHGPWGEDGTLQGMLDILGIPYVGSGTLASALAMDKAMAKRVLSAEGIPVARGVVIEAADYDADPGRGRERAREILPGVVKPSRQGSSVGMALVDRPDALPSALEEAFRYDDKVLVEERLRGTELSVGVLGNRDLQALPVIEIVPKRDFFDYRAKYDARLTDEICPARIPQALADEVQELALRAHRALDCRGLSRTDFICDAKRGPVVLELNTMPGMTINSLLPKAARVAGISFPELLDRLVQLALEPRR
jgi:D-alanine-D-alanine ligase